MSTNPNNVSTEKTWQTEFNRRIEAFAQATKMEVATVIDLLKKLGIDSQDEDCLTLLDSDQFLPASDIFKTFVDEEHAPIARVRMGIAHIRGQTTLDEPKPTLNGNQVIVESIAKLVKKVEDFSVEELLEKCDDLHPEVVERLNRIAHGRPCIILNSDGTKNIPESIKMIQTARKQPTSDRHIVEGKVVRVYRPGLEVVKPLDESPFWRNVALVNGVCSRSGTDWNGVDIDARILARIYVLEIETRPLSKMEMKQINEDAKACKETDKDYVRKQYLAIMREKYSEAALRFDELKELGKLPTLKISHKDAIQEPVGSKDTGFQS